MRAPRSPSRATGRPSPSPSPAELEALIARTFACSADVARAIAACAALRCHPPRAVLIRAGDRAGETFLLVAGRAQAVIYSIDGACVLIDEYGAGDLFGALTADPPPPQEIEVLAIEASDSAIFAGRDFVGLAEQYACVGLAVSRLLLARIQRASGQFYRRMALSAAGRVHAELLRLARAGGDLAIRPPPVLTTLALHAACTRETASRAVNALERRGFITRSDEALTILSAERLEELVL